MNPLRIEATAKTPEVLLDPHNNIFEIKGKSVPEDAESFFGKILKWFDDYVVRPNSDTSLRIDLEYFNISSSKRILFLLYKLKELSALGHKVNIQWFYNNADEDMFEVGQDYEFMVKLPFEFIERHERLVAAS